MTKSWRPRASSLGFYWSCSQRAAFDRGIAEDVFPGEIRDDSPSKPYASLGTVIHFYLQDGLRAQFPGPSKDYAPTPEEVTDAAKLFGGDTVSLMRAVEASARVAAQHMPKLPNGAHWRAEVSVDAGSHLAPGHIDFLSSDGSIIVDLKTTRTKPYGGRMKREALVQLTNYALNAGASWGRAIYVDSMGGSWCTPIDIDWTKEETQVISQQIPRLVASLTSPSLYDAAYPGPLDDSCGDMFCPYTRVCRDAIVPRADSQYTKKEALAPTGAMQL